MSESILGALRTSAEYWLAHVQETGPFSYIGEIELRHFVSMALALVLENERLHSVPREPSEAESELKHLKSVVRQLAHALENATYGVDSRGL